jgi:hypothetical protein
VGEYRCLRCYVICRGIYQVTWHLKSVHNEAAVYRANYRLVYGLFSSEAQEADRFRLALDSLGGADDLIFECESQGAPADDPERPIGKE